MATLYKLPIIFVVENNKWAIGMDHDRATAVKKIYLRGEAFGMPGILCDGMDVLSVRSAY